MRRIRAGVAQTVESGKLRTYKQRRKEGLCVTCGSPAADGDGRAVIILCRGQYTVERGSKAARCYGCTVKEKESRLKRCRTFSSPS